MHAVEVLDSGSEPDVLHRNSRPFEPVMPLSPDRKCKSKHNQ